MLGSIIDVLFLLQIGLPQGLNMLNIMKAYPLTTSILDDFDFYENREKSLYKAKSSEPVMLRSGVGFYKEETSLVTLFLTHYFSSELNYESKLNL